MWGYARCQDTPTVQSRSGDWVLFYAYVASTSRKPNNRHRDVGGWDILIILDIVDKIVNRSDQPIIRIHIFRGTCDTMLHTSFWCTHASGLHGIFPHEYSISILFFLDSRQHAGFPEWCDCSKHHVSLLCKVTLNVSSPSLLFTKRGKTKGLSKILFSPFLCFFSRDSLISNEPYVKPQPFSWYAIRNWPRRSNQPQGSRRAHFTKVIMQNFSASSTLFFKRYSFRYRDLCLVPRNPSDTS